MAKTRAKEFAVLLFELSQMLHREEIDAIRHIENLPVEMDGKSGLHILVKLQMQGKITDSDPSTLQEVFKDVNRVDLINRVKEFVKSRKAFQRKSKKKMVKNNTEAEELLFGLKANLEVSQLQARLLRDQLSNLAAAAAAMSGKETVQQIIQQAIRAVESEVEGRLQHVKEEMEGKYQSSPECSDDDKSPPRTLMREQYHLVKEDLDARITRG